MARVIIPDVSPFVASAIRQQRVLDPNAGRKRDESAPEKFAKVLAIADKVASSPLLIGAIDAYRRSQLESSDRGLSADIAEATEIGREDMLRAAAQKRMEAQRGALPPAAGPSGQMAAVPTEQAGPLRAEQDYLAAQGLNPAQAAAVSRMAEEARRSGRPVTRGVLDTLIGAAKEGQLLATQPVQREWSPETERAALQQAAREQAGQQMTQGLMQEIEASKERQFVKDERQAIKAAKIAALSEALSAADTMEEIEAIRRQMDAIRQSTPVVEVPNQDRFLGRRTVQMAAPTLSSQFSAEGLQKPYSVGPAPAPAIQPEMVGGIPVYTPGAGQSMATTREEADLEREMQAEEAGGAGMLNKPYFVGPMETVPSPSTPAAESRSALPPVAGPSPEVLEAPAPYTPPSTEDKMEAGLGKFAQAIRLTTPEEVMLAARTARTPEEQRIVSMAAANVAARAPATNIFQALGLAPVDSTKFVKEVVAAFPKDADSDTRVRLQQLKIELEQQRANARSARDKALYDAQLRNLNKQLELIIERNKSKIDRNKSKIKTPEEKKTESELAERQMQVKEKQARAALVSAGASAKRAKAYAKYIEDMGPRKAKEKLVSDIKKQQAAQNAEQRVLEREIRKNQSLPELPPFTKEPPKKAYGKAAEEALKAYNKEKAEYEKRRNARAAENAKAEAARKAAEKRMEALGKEREKTDRDLQAITGLAVPGEAAGGGGTQVTAPPPKKAGSIFPKP